MNALALLLLASIPPAPSAGAIETLDLGKLTWLDAQRLHGKPVRVTFTVGSWLEFTDAGRGVIVEAEGAAGVSRCVRFSPGAHVPALWLGTRHVVDGVLR